MSAIQKIIDVNHELKEIYAHSGYIGFEVLDFYYRFVLTGRCIRCGEYKSISFSIKIKDFEDMDENRIVDLIFMGIKKNKNITIGSELFCYEHS